MISSLPMLPKKTQKTRTNSKFRRSIPYIIVCLAAVAVCSIISLNFFRLMLIQGESMSPTYHNLQLVLLDVRNREIQYDDVIAFKCDSQDIVLVKRVVGLPGDTLEIRNGKLYVNDLLSDYFANTNFLYSGVLNTEYTIPEGCCFAIGDNTDESIDCRYNEIGDVEIDNIIGVIIPTGF